MVGQQQRSPLDHQLQPHLQAVASQVGEIQRQTNPAQWRYVPTVLNRPIPKRLSGFVKGGTRASQHV